jgi:hypothetical protein
MYQRNYPCDNIIDVYWGTQNLAPVGEAAFKRQLYQCLIGAGLELKSDIEVRRSGNEFGTVTWQLNEIWPTGGWGSLEYGTPVKGQVIGGRWKPVHYWFKRSLYTDVTSSCGASDPPDCYIKNDGPVPFVGTVTISLTNFQNGKTYTVSTNNVNLAAGAGTTQWVCAKSGTNNQCMSWADILKIGNCTTAGDGMFIISIVRSSDKVEVSRNELALTTIDKMNLLKANLNTVVDSNGQITVSTDNTAAYVTLTTLAHGRFSDNAFLLQANQRRVISFVPFGPLDINTLKSTLRVEHAKLYKN